MPKESTPGKGRAHRGHLTIFGLAILTTIGGFPVAYQFVEPAPPRKIVIATGDKSGAYYAFAQRYKKVLARDCITLEIRSTAGSGENLKLLTERENGVDIALVQGGMFRAERVNPPKKFGLAWRNWIKLKMKFFLYPSPSPTPVSFTIWGCIFLLSGNP